MVTSSRNFSRQLLIQIWLQMKEENIETLAYRHRNVWYSQLKSFPDGLRLTGSPEFVKQALRQLQRVKSRIFVYAGAWQFILVNTIKLIFSHVFNSKLTEFIY